MACGHAAESIRSWLGGGSTTLRPYTASSCRFSDNTPYPRTPGGCTTHRSAGRIASGTTSGPRDAEQVFILGRDFLAGSHSEGRKGEGWKGVAEGKERSPNQNELHSPSARPFLPVPQRCT